MLRRDRQVRMEVNRWVDGLVFALALWLGHAIRRAIGHGIELQGFDYHADPIARFSDYLWLFIVVIPMAPFILEWQGFYEKPIFAPRAQRAWHLLRACAICTIGLILVDFFFASHLARGVFVLFGVCSFGLMMLKDETLLWVFRTPLGKAQFNRRVVLVGSSADTGRLRQELCQGSAQLEVVAEMDLNETSIEDLVSCLHAQSINMVVLTARHTLFGAIEKAIQACEVEGVEAWLVADFFQTHISRTSLDDFFGRPVLVFHSVPEMAWSRLVKQIFDFIGASLLLLGSSIVMVPVALIIKLTSKGPIFFKQERAGLNGQPFTMYKFRSMVSNAEQLKQELAALNEMSGPVFKISQDPRVTPIGRWMRRWSVDELPQLFNVLRFEMSLVGPRPLPVDEVKRFDDPSQRRRLSVKPGLTCLWQVGGRNNVSNFGEWVRLDLQYIDNWSMWLDVKILWKTVWVVLRGTGAH